MPSRASSLASVFENPVTAGLSALESIRPAIGCLAEIDVMLMMRPPPRSAHVRHGLHAQQHRAHQHEVDRVPPVRLGRRAEQARLRPARIGDENVEAAEMPDGLIDQPR